MATKADKNDETDLEIDVEGVEIDIEDDTPPEDRNREPLPKELVKELEEDELEAYDDKVKQRLKQMKKAWHDERREKEQAVREHNEAVTLAQRLIDDNRNLRGSLSRGETHLVTSYQQTAEVELENARTEYKAAYEAGDTDKLLAAQEKLNDAAYRLNSLKAYRPTVQEEEPGVTIAPTPAPPPKPDQKTLAWQERNSWWGVDPEMTATALGFHQKLEREKGAAYVGTDEYWRDVDATMRKRYPEYFGSSENRTRGRRSTVVAPVTRTNAPKRVTLTQSQVSLAKRLGLTPEQYAREMIKLNQQ